MASYKQNNFNNPGINQGFFSKMLRKISNYGLTYNIDTVQQSYAVGINDDPKTFSNQGNIQTAGPYQYDLFTKKVIAKVLDKKSIAYLDRSYFDKRKIMQQYSIKDEIREFITLIADEVIIYDDNNKFCKAADLPEEFDDVIRKKVHENFAKLYNSFGFNDSITAWSHLKDLLINGFLAFEIVYDKKQKNIVDIVKLDPITLVVASDPESGTIVWVQYPDDPRLRRVLLDAQIIYISYGNNQDYGEVSYVEPLIRPYNQVKLIEQTKLLYNINQAAVYKKFVIPVGGLSRQQAEQQIYQLMSEYHEEVTWDDNLGTISINGSSHIPHSKDIWLPSSAEGQPDVTIETPQGNDLNEDQILNWFMNNLKRASKIPYSRFEKESGGGNIYSDASEMTRDEMKFHNFIKRIRTLFREIMVKPLRIQMMRDFPELIENPTFLSVLNITFNSNELFEEWKYLNNLEKRSNIASSLSSNLQANPDGVLASEWIIRNIMKFTDDDIAENNKYKLKEKGQLGEGEEGEEDGKGGGKSFGPGAPFFGEEGGMKPVQKPQGQGGQAQAGGQIQTPQMGGQTQVPPQTPQTGGGQTQAGGQAPQTGV
jgi:hypothetical protein